MQQVKTFAPANSIVFISDIGGGQPPIPIRDEMIWSTPSCVVVVCYPEIDGPTTLILKTSDETDPKERPAFDGDLDTPQQQIVVSTVDDIVLLKSPTPRKKTRLVIWRSHPKWPKVVTVAFS